MAVSVVPVTLWHVLSQPILLPKTFVGVADELIGSVAFLVEKEVLKCSFNQVSVPHCM